MKLSEKGFNLLTFIAKHDNKQLSQKGLAADLGISVGMVNKLVNEFLNEGLLNVDSGIHITDAGLEFLEPYRVHQAIILAAGFSERLAPITLETPKPLVEVGGVRIVDTLIDALLAEGIENISVVVGYKPEAFKVLSEKYPGIKLVQNELYNFGGNILSLDAAMDGKGSTLICDADLYIHNPEVIRRYEYSSCFFGYPTFATDDWCFSLSGKTIKNLRIGGERCYKAVFITYLNEEDSAKCRSDISSLINSRGGKEHHWFDVLRKGYKLSVKECYADDISEVDTLADLIKLDDSYLGISL